MIYTYEVRCLFCNAHFSSEIIKTQVLKIAAWIKYIKPIPIPLKVAMVSHGWFSSLTVGNAHPLIGGGGTTAFSSSTGIING